MRSQVYDGGCAAHLPDGRPSCALQLLHELGPLPHESQVLRCTLSRDAEETLRAGRYFMSLVVCGRACCLTIREMFASLVLGRRVRCCSVSPVSGVFGRARNVALFAVPH